MTTARELGVTYLATGALQQPELRPRLNQKGAKYVTGFAKLFEEPIVEVSEGYQTMGFSMGVNGLAANVLIYRKDGKLAAIPIDIERDDYFLKPEDKPAA